jgi:hypothetical protein
MNSQSSSISVAGTLLNLSHAGFNPSNLLCELIENSISAGAKKVCYCIDTQANTITLVDDANGMDCDGLYKYGTLNKRSEATADSHGRFGIGGKHALTGLTDYKNVLIISKPETNISKTFNMKIDFAAAIKNNTYVLHPDDLTVIASKLWDINAYDKDASGTVQILYSTQAIISEISKGISSDDIINSYRFQFGCIFKTELRKGLTIEFVIDGKSYNVGEFDRLKYDEIDSKYKQERSIDVYQLPNGQYRFRYIGEDKKSHWRDCSASKKGTDNQTEIQKNDKFIDKITLRHTYATSDDWDALQKDALEKMGLKIRSPKESGKPVERDLQGGTEYIRNDKQITHYTPRIPNSDTSTYMRDSHHAVEFKASEIMDAIFNVQVNKSDLKENNIHKDLLGTITVLCKEFTNLMEKKKKAEAATGPTTATETSIPNLLNVVVKAATPIKPVSAPSKATPAAPVKTAPVKSMPVKSMPAAPAKSMTSAPLVQAKSTPVKVAEIPIKPATPLQPVSTTINHSVRFSKTEKDLIVHAQQELICNIPYTGQYNIIEKCYNEILMHLGEKRFIEFLKKKKAMGVFDLDRVYFN